MEPSPRGFTEDDMKTEKLERSYGNLLRDMAETLTSSQNMRVVIQVTMPVGSDAAMSIGQQVLDLQAAGEATVQTQVYDDADPCNEVGPVIYFP